MEKADIAYYKTRLSNMKTARYNHDNYWQEVADYTFPRRDFTTERSQADKRMNKIFDSTAIYATEQLAAGLHGMLTPSFSKWFFLKAPSVKESDDIRSWLDTAADRLSYIFSSPDTSFATSVFEFYMDIVAFGNGAMAVTYSNGNFRFLVKPLRSCYIEENDAGNVDVLYICEKMSPANIIKKFGIENVSEKVVKAHSSNQSVKYEILHAIEPRKNNKGRGAAKELKPYKSCFIDIENSKLMLEEGFDDFPFLYSRWSKRSGETYGYGSGMVALPEVKELNKIAEIMTRAASKNIDPPVLSPVEGLVLPMRLDPSSINYYNPELGVPTFWSNGFQPNYFENVMEYKRELINKMYYVDWMNLPKIDRQTTVEVMQRAQEGQRMMSPMLSRLQSEFLSRLISRTLVLAIDNGEIARPPVELQGANVQIEYTSPLSIAQRASSSQSVLQALTVGSQLAQFDQRVALRINADAIFKDQALNTYSLPIKYLRTDDEVAELSAQQQEQQQSAEQAAQIESYSKSAKNAAGAMVDLGGV